MPVMETAPRDLLRHLRDLGLELVLDGECLRVRGLAALDASLRESTADMIRRRKPDILRALDLEASLARQLSARQPACTEKDLWPPVWMPTVSASSLTAMISGW